MRSDIGRRVITYQDPDGTRRQIRYSDLLINLGRSQKLSLEECLWEEESRVKEFQRDAARLAKKINSLTPLYRKHDRTERAWHEACRNRTKDINKLPYHKRMRMLNTYFCVDRSHVKTIDELERYVLAGTEGDHTPHVKSLIRFTIDYTASVMKDVVRKTGRPCVLHSLAAARGVAKNGQSHITIIGTMLHDVLEERVDIWADRFVRSMLGDPRYAHWDVAPGAKIPKPLRQQILLDHEEEYNTRAAAILFAIGLALFDHVRKFPLPQKYYGTVNSIMEMVEKLSRTRDVSYYQYLQLFMYPRRGDPDPIRRSDLIEILSEEFVEPGLLLDEYLEHVDGFYSTPDGNYYSREELKRNALREMLAKIVDRINNTRDMDRDLNFSIPSRLYGAGFKNIYFVQAIEDRMALGALPSNEQRLLEEKFLTKPKIAALYQILDDIEYLEREESGIGRSYIEMLESELSKYKTGDEFRSLTEPTQRGLFDGTIYFFNEVILGNKQFLKDLTDKRDKQAEYLVVFRAVLEAFILYPAMLEQDMELNGYVRPSQSLWNRYRIEGMGPRLGHRVKNRDGTRAMNVKTFKRRVM